MTETVKATSSVSTERRRRDGSVRRSRDGSKKPTKSSKQRANAQSRWNGVSPAERSKTAREIARIRWAAEEKGYAEAEKYFQTEDLDTALETYSGLRAIFEMAGKTLDTRIQKERESEERCSNPACRRQLGKDQHWYYRDSRRDPNNLQRLYNVFACSQACMVAIQAPGTQQRPAPASDARAQRSA